MLRQPDIEAELADVLEPAAEEIVLAAEATQLLERLTVDAAVASRNAVHRLRAAGAAEIREGALIPEAGSERAIERLR